MPDCVGLIQYECGTIRPVDPTVTSRPDILIGANYGRQIEMSLSMDVDHISSPQRWPNRLGMTHRGCASRLTDGHKDEYMECTYISK